MFKRLYIFGFFLGACMISEGQRKFDFGIAGVYGDEINQIGQNTRFYVNSDDHRFCLGPEFSWFLQDEITEGNELVKKDLIEFNFNAHINLKVIGDLSFYPVIGLNYSREKESVFQSGELDHRKNINEFGLIAGAGLHYNLGTEWLLFSEYDHLFSKLRQNTFTIGILKSFGKITSHKNHEESSSHEN